MNLYGLADIDNFSKFNHEFGYEKGNIILKLLEDLLKEKLTPVFLKRLDSDEFIFQLAGSFNENDKIIFDLLKASYDKLGITISIGLVESDNNFDFKLNIGYLMSNMLIAKKYGKNKICLK